MDLKGLALFDIDGVIRDVGKSYRLALKKTVNRFSGWTPSNVEIDSLKSEGCWNNDWDASLELIKRHIARQKLLTKAPTRKDLIAEFNDFYFGGNCLNNPTKWNGFIKNEPLLVNKSFFKKLTNLQIGWGFISGAELPSAKFALETRLGLTNPPLLAMGQAPEKPNPSGLIQLASKLYAKNLGKNVPPISYLGDTVADVLTIQKAREVFPEQIFISLAIAPPHLHEQSQIIHRKAYEQSLRDAGADHILSSINDIFQALSDW